MKHIFTGVLRLKTPLPPSSSIFAPKELKNYFDRVLLKGKGNTIFVEFGLVVGVLLLKTIDYLAQML